MNIPSAKEVRDCAIRSAITELLPRLTEKQVAFLNRIHDNAPWGGLANCPPERLDETYELIRRTEAA